MSMYRNVPSIHVHWIISALFSYRAYNLDGASSTMSSSAESESLASCYPRLLLSLDSVAYPPVS